MGFITKLKQLFGIESEQPSRAAAGSGVDVTVEREPGEPTADAEGEPEVAPEHGAETDTTAEPEPEGGTQAESATEAEPAVEEPVATETTAAASTESLIEEAVKEDEKQTSAERAEPAEAAGPGAEAGTTDVDEVAADATAEAAGAGAEGVDAVKGIGPAYAEKLEDAGIPTVGDLAEADVEAVAAETGVSESRLGRWVERAHSRL